MTMRNMSGALTPGDSLRTIYGSEAARRNGSPQPLGHRLAGRGRVDRRDRRASSREELTTPCRALDRVLRAQRSMIPCWHNDSAWLAYGNQFGKPERPPRFAPTSGFQAVVLGTWWYDEEKAKKLG